MTSLIKPAQFSDIPFLWYLRNQPDVYQYSKTAKPVSWEEHINWITPLLLSLIPKKLYVITYEKLPVGQLRFDYAGNEAEMSISLLKEFRGKGIASETLKQGIANVKKERTAKTLIAQIHENNLASVALFEKYHFSYQTKKNHYHYYSLLV